MGFFFLYIHRMPRKIALVMALGVLTCCQWSLICFNFDRKADHPYFSFGLFCAFVFVFQLTLGPIAWIQTNELLQPRLTSLAASCNWLANFLTMLTVRLAQTYYPGVSAIKYFTILFALSCLLGGVFVMLWFPETVGRSREQLAEDSEEIFSFAPD